MTQEFKHVFEEDPKWGDLTVEVDTTGDEKIHINIEDDSKIWISANKKGWLHLARLCAELGSRDLKPGYHVHLDFDFKSSNSKKEEISFEVSD